MARYGFAIDLERCVGCHTCSVACRIENNLPEGVWWNRVMTDGGPDMDTPKGTFPNVEMGYVTLACQHCDNPACVNVCPVGATYIDPTTGAVRQDYDTCIGCRMCMAACPYTGVRSFNWEEPKSATGVVLGSDSVPSHQKHVVEKCSMCFHRIAEGLDPACIETCPSRARFWGDLDDPDSEISTLIAGRSFKKLLDDRGTSPKVFYLT